MEDSLTRDERPVDTRQKYNSFVMPSLFTIRLEMKSDWHIGTGAGQPGNIDKLLARDADGFPFVPAKTLNGIWRDALETLTFGLDGGKEGYWSKWVEIIFGVQPNQLQGVLRDENQGHELQRRVKNGDSTYSFALLSVQPARLSKNLREKIDKSLNAVSNPDDQRQQRRRLLGALTFIKPGVSIDEKTGTARTDFLRFEEMGRAGTVLESECALDFDSADSESQRIISALLLLSARLVERIGGKRRRGAGLCELKIDAGAASLVADAVNLLKGKEKEKTSPPSAFRPGSVSDERSIVREIDSTNSDSISEGEDRQEKGWQTLEFTLRLRAPVSIVTATLGNVSESLDYIPGTYLLPHITKVLRKRIGGKVFQAVAYGDLQVLSATVEVNNERGLPTPAVIYYEKMGGGFDREIDGKATVYNLFKEWDKIEIGVQKKSLRSGYVSSLDGNGQTLPTHKETIKTFLVHNTVEDRVQRPTENVGGVYSRQAIASGTRLRGEIRLRSKLAGELDSDWWTELSGSVRLGTSRKDDYGLAELELKKDAEGRATGPSAFKPKSEVNSNDNKLVTVYLVSDCIVRNANLRQTNLGFDLAQEIGDKLGVALYPIDSEHNAATSLVMAKRIDSWHEGWGFPRPTLIAMRAGSCAVFQSDVVLDLVALQRLEAEGIGERRGEGYGQVRFNPPLLMQPINGWEVAAKADEAKADEAKPAIPAAIIELNDEERAFAELIEETAWREELKVAALKIADGLNNRKAIFGFDSEKNEPPMSQIGGLRSAISRLRRVEDKGIVINWLEHLKATPNRRDRWANSKENADAKLDKIIELLEPESRMSKTEDESHVLWKRFQGVFKEPLTIVRSRKDLQKQLWAEAVRTLFDACARAHKREVEKKETN